MKFYDYMTEFIFVEHQPEKADIIFVPGGNYPDSARYAAQLYKEGWAPYVMPSGKYSIVTGKFVLAEQMRDAELPKESVYETEWDYLRGILMDRFC